MSREPRAIWQQRFDLEQHDAAQVKLHQFLEKLAESGKASAWIRQTLIAALPQALLVPPPIVVSAPIFTAAPDLNVALGRPDPTYSDDDVENP